MRVFVTGASGHLGSAIVPELVAAGHDVVGDHLGLPTASIPAEGLEAHFGFLATLIVLDNPTSTLATRRRLGWEPTHPGLLADFDSGDYFTASAPHN